MKRPSLAPGVDFGTPLSPGPTESPVAKRWLLTFVLILQGGLSPAALFSNERLLRGGVHDGTGKAIPGAAVTLRNTRTGLERTASTDSIGNYTFAGVGDDEHRLTACAPGFSCASRSLDAETQEVRLELQPAPVIDHVTVVSGSRQEELRESLNTRVEVVDRSRIRDTGYETVAEVLREVPGVVTRRGSETTGAAGEQVQGIDSRQVLVLLDGQPLINARGIKRGGILNLDRQSVGRLERVEVVKGASSALYGSDAIGGVINLISREPVAPLEGAVTLSGGSYGALDSRGEVGFARNRLSGFLTLERHKNNGFDLTPTTYDTTGAGFHRYDGLLKLKYQLNPGFSLSAFANGFWNQSQGRSIGELGPQENTTDEESENYGLTADWQVDSRTALQARGYFARYDEVGLDLLAQGGSAPLPGNLYQRLGKGDATVSRLLGEHQFLQAGGEWWSDRYRGLNRLRDDGGHRAETRVAWFQDRISLANRVTFTLGVRYDDHSIFGSAISPKLALNLRVREGFHVRASYGHGFRAPDLGQLYYRFLNPTNFYQIIGNPDLQPERANSWQAGAEYSTAAQRVRVGLNLFRNDVSNLIDSVSLGFVVSPVQLAALMQHEGIDPAFRPQLNRLLFRYKNLASVFTQGIELDGDVAFSRSWLLGGGYTYLDARDKHQHLPLTGRNRHQGFLRLAWSPPRLGLRANLRGTFYSSWIAARSMLGDSIQDTVSPNFNMWDGYVAKDLRRGLEIFAAADNFTNSRDPNTGVLTEAGTAAPIYRPEVGRTLRLGIRYSFVRENQ